MEAARTGLGRINPRAVSSSNTGKTALMLGESCQPPHPTGEANHLDSGVVISWLLVSERRKWPLRAHTFSTGAGKGKKPVEFWVLRGEMQGEVNTVFSSQGQCWQPHGASGAGGLTVPGAV